LKNLDSFLKEQEVGAIDSTGEFTIAADKALQKLAHSQLPDPSYWILKVVQAATCLGADHLEVKVGRRVSALKMHVPAEISVLQLQRGLDSIATLPEPGPDHLVTALRALGGIKDRMFGLTLGRADCNEYLMWDGEKLSTRKDKNYLGVSSGTVVLLEVSVKTGDFWRREAGAITHRTGEIYTLGSRAFVAPLQLTVDGRSLSYEHLDEASFFVQPLLWDYAPYEHGAYLPHFMTVYSDRKIPASAFWNLTYNYTLQHKVLRLSPEPEEKLRVSRVYWTKDGVIVKRTELRPMMPFTINLFVDCRDCPADLGGLNLRETPEFQAKREWVVTLLDSIGKSAGSRILALKELEGKSLGGWDTVVATTSHLPLSGAVRYTGPGFVANTLNAHPGFRKKLLAKVKAAARSWQTIVPSKLDFRI
jgi:hypothetical protein